MKIETDPLVVGLVSWRDLVDLGARKIEKLGSKKSFLKMLNVF
jgi:hypothetical protein